MLERCIKLEPLFTAAYLELVKLYSGPQAGQLLRRVVRLNPYDVDLRRQYGDWLAEQSKFRRVSPAHSAGVYDEWTVRARVRLSGFDWY